MNTEKITFLLLALFMVIVGGFFVIVTHKTDLVGDTLAQQTFAEVVPIVSASSSVAPAIREGSAAPVATTTATTSVHHVVAAGTSTHLTTVQATATIEKVPVVSVSLKPTRVLVVAGHEPMYGGAEYRNLKERSMTLAISQYLRSYFASNSQFEVVVVRDTQGWNPVFSSYFKTNATATKEFLLTHKAEMTKQIARGEVTEVVGVPHNAAPEEVALHLYGINRWANDNDIDLVLHIHFNDVPRVDTRVPGKYTGLALYVPEQQYKNSSTSIAIAKVLFPYVLKYNSVSTLPTESLGIIEDQELIALGKYNTLTVPSILIEYGYIYESKFQDPVSADILFKKLAQQTYTGVVKYFAEAK